MQRLRLLILGIIVVLATPHRSSHAQGAETALLLGLRYPQAIQAPLPYYVAPADSISRPAYRTLLLVRRPGGQVQLASDRPGLVVPRKSGLWRVDAKRSIYNNWVEDFVWSAPIGRKGKLPGIQAYNGEYCGGHRVQVIHLAAPGFLSVEQRSAGYCEDAAHPWYTSAYAVVPIDSTTHTGLPISAVLGKPARDALEAGAERFLSGLKSEQDRLRYFPQPDEANWAVVRKNGRWALRGRVDSEEVASSQVADFDLSMRPPASLVGFDELQPSWEHVKRFAPGAVDAVSSPQKDLLVILRPGRVTVHPVEKASIGAAILDVPVPAGTTLVMSQWTHTAVQHWVRALRSRPESTAVGWQSGRR